MLCYCGHPEDEHEEGGNGPCLADNPGNMGSCECNAFDPDDEEIE